MNPKISVVVDSKNRAVSTVSGMVTVGAKVDIEVRGLPSPIPSFGSSDDYTGPSLRFRLVDEFGRDVVMFPLAKKTESSPDSWTVSAGVYSASNVEFDTMELRRVFEGVQFNDVRILGAIFDSAVDDAQYAVGTMKVRQWATARSDDPKTIPDWRETLARLDGDLSTVNASKAAAETAATSALDSKTRAAESMGYAAQYAQAASQSSISASLSASTASTAASTATSAKTAAEAARDASIAASSIRPKVQNSRWYVWNASLTPPAYEDTGVKATGSDGLTPYIGANGNWYIGSSDTGVTARGQKGDTGTTDWNGLTNVPASFTPSQHSHTTLEVNGLEAALTDIRSTLAGITTFSVQVVDALPQTGSEKVIYLVPSPDPKASNVKDEYIWVGGAWEQIGSTAVDLTDYSTTSQMNSAIASAVGGVTVQSIGAVGANDSRLTDARTPTAHKSSHATGGADAIAPSDIGALPLVVDKEGNKTAVTVGTREDGDVGVSSDVNGDSCVASGGYSHSEGHCTTASGDYSHAEGGDTLASGEHAHAEGESTTASGNGAHADGTNAVASHNHSYAFSGDSENTYSSHGEGTYNINPKPQGDGETDPASGFFVGETSLMDMLGEKANTDQLPYGIAPVERGILHNRTINTSSSGGNFVMPIEDTGKALDFVLVVLPSATAPSIRLDGPQIGVPYTFVSDDPDVWTAEANKVNVWYFSQLTNKVSALEGGKIAVAHKAFDTVTQE